MGMYDDILGGNQSSGGAYDDILNDAEPKKQDSALTRGITQANSARKTFGALATGDYDAAAKLATERDAYQRANPGTPEGNQLMSAWEKGDGIIGGIKGVAGEFAKDWREAPSGISALQATGKNLSAMGGGIVEQIPNMVMPMAGMLAGGAAGSLAGPVGTVGGAFAGAATGNTAAESAEQVDRAIRGAGINPQDTGAVRSFLEQDAGGILGKSAIKGGIIGAVDTATMGIGGKMLRAPVKAATDRAIASLGINAADNAVVTAAREQIGKAVLADPIYQASQKGAQALARNATVGALEPVGEFAGEYLGQGAATGDWDTKGAMLEALSSLGQSGITYAGQKIYQAATSPLRGIKEGNQTAPQDTPTVPPDVSLIADPVPVQQRIDAMLGLDTARMDDKGRALYEKDLAAAFNEPIGIRLDADQNEVPYTMGEYLDSQVRSASAKLQATDRLNQLAEEEAQQHAAITQDLVQSASQGGALSQAALTGIQTGATQMPVHPERAAIEQQMLADEAAQAELAPIERLMRTRSDEEVQRVADNPKANPKMRQVAIADLQRRMATKAQPTTTSPLQQTATQFNLPENSRAAQPVQMAQAPQETNVPQDGIEQGAAPQARIKRLQAQLENTEPFTEQSFALIDDLQSAVTQDAQSALNAGEMPVYKVTDHVSVAIHPSAQNPGMVQVTRYAKDGVIGDSQYNNVYDAVRQEGLTHKPRIASNEAAAVIEKSIQAESEYQQRKSAAPVPNADAGIGVGGITRKRSIENWTADELQARLNRADAGESPLQPESRQKIEAELAKRPARKAPINHGLSVGKAPNSAAPVTVRNGIIFIGDEPAVNYDTEQDIKIASDATPRQIVDALKSGGAIATSQRFYGLPAEPKAEKQKPDRRQIDATKDTLFQAIAKLGGMDTQELTSNGFDQKDISVRHNGRVIQSGKNKGQLTKPSFKSLSLGFNMPLHKKGGMSFDGVLEELKQHGYFPEDATKNDAIEAFRKELGGDAVMTPDVAMQQAEMQAEQEANDAIGYDDLSDLEKALVDFHAENIYDEDSPIEAFKRGMKRDGATEDEINEAIKQTFGAQETGNNDSGGTPQGTGETRDAQGADDGLQDGEVQEGAEPDWLTGQTNEQAAAELAKRKADIAEEKRQHEELIAQAKRESNAKEKARRAAQVLAEREAAKKAEVDKAAEDFALGQAAPAPVERKVTTDDARGQQDVFAQVKQDKPVQSNAKSDASLERTKNRNEVRFETPYIGIGGNYSLVGYVWPNKKEEYIDRRGEDRVRTVSDWEAAVENLETGRQIVHQFAVKKSDGTEQDVSAETAAKLLGVSESTVRNNAKKQLEKAIAKEKSRILEIKEADDLDAIDAQDSPAMAVSKRAMTYSNNSPMIERMAKSGESWATIDNRIERESAGREKYRFLTKDGKFVWSHSFVKEGDEEYKRGWRNAEFTASEIWPEQPVKATTEAKAVEPWQMTSAEFAQNELANSEYKDSYERKPDYKAEFLKDQLIPWRKAVEGAAKDNVIPDNVLDDYREKLGDATLHSMFRGVTEKGISEWEPKETRVWDKTYKVFLRDHSARIVSGDKKALHRSAIERALKQGKPVPANVLADYPDLKPKAVEPAAQSAEQKIRSAFDALPSVSLGVAYPITVEHNGVKREFMVRQDALGRGKIPALHVVAIHQGRMIASDEKSWIAQSYKLNWKNELTEEGLPKKISDQEADEFKANFKDKQAAVDAKKEAKSDDVTSQKKRSSTKQMQGDSGLGNVTISKASSIKPIADILSSENAVQVSVTGGNSDVLNRIAKAFGKQIIFFRSVDGGRSEDRNMGARTEQPSSEPKGSSNSLPGNGYVTNGFVNTGRPNTVFLNVDSSNHLLYILGHELGHTLRIEDAKLWASMAKQLQPLVRKWSQYKDSLASKSSDESENAEELFGDIIGQNFLNKEFWNDFAKTNESLFKKVSAAAIRIINKALKLVVGQDASIYVSDMEQARAIIASTMSKYADGVANGLYAKYSNDVDSAYINKRTGESDDGIRYSKKNNQKNSDAEYLAAVDRGDIETAQRMVDKAALDAGYISANDYRMMHQAPNSKDDISLIDIRESGLVPDDYWTTPRWYQGTSEEMDSFNKVISALRRLDSSKEKGQSGSRVGVWVYRAVPKDVKDSAIRNGDWVTPSRDYAVNEGKMIPEGYRIISQHVLLKNLYWDANSIAELGVDDGKDYAYKNTKNNRKLIDAVTYDDEGNVIPLSKRFNSRSDDVRHSKASNKSWYYSQLAKAIEQAPDRVFTTGTQVKLWLAGNKSKVGIKDDEIQWTGINDFLDLQGKGKVTKADVLAYLDGNGVQVQEVVKGEDLIGALQAKIDAINDKYNSIIDEYGVPVQELPVAAKEEIDKLTIEHDAIADEMSAMHPADNETKYATYQLPGGTNYRELLLTLPDDRIAAQERYDAIAANARASGRSEMTPDEVSERSDLFHKIKGKGRYKSSHWDEPNILAHIRMNDRVDADGNKVLFIEEIQSDYGQTGKKRGFKTPDVESERAAYRAEMKAKYPMGHLDKRQTQEEIARGERLNAAVNGLPPAPFVTDTKSWVSLAVKRVMAYAAANGYAKVAFVNGEQSADRYDLSKQVKEIQYIKRGDKYDIAFTDNNGEGHNPGEFSASELENVVGKEVAQKIIDGEGKSYRGREAKTLEGLDLKVGGEGMKTFYNQIVPQVLSDVLKKVGGKAEIVNVVEKEGRPARSSGAGVWKMTLSAEPPLLISQTGFTITPEMREKVAGGLPLFARSNIAQGKSFPRAQAESRIKSIIGEKLGKVLIDSGIVTFTNKGNEYQGATYKDGSIVLNLDALNADNFDGVFKHEGVHSVLRETLGEETYQQLEKRFVTMMDMSIGRKERIRLTTGQGEPTKANGTSTGAVKEWFNKAIAAIPKDTKPADYVQEIMGYATEQYTNGAKQPNIITRWVESLLSALRTAIIRKLPFGKLKSWAVNNLQPQDLANLAIAGLKAKARGQLQAQGREAMAFSRNENGDNVLRMADKDTGAGTQAPTSAGDGSTGSASLLRDVLGMLSPRASIGGVGRKAGTYSTPEYYSISSMAFDNKRFDTFADAVKWAEENGFSVKEYRDGFGNQAAEITHIETQSALVKQSNIFKEKWSKAKPVYLRYGKLPPGGKSRNYADNIMESGVSVFNGYILPNGEVRVEYGTNQQMGTGLAGGIQYRDVYVASGDEIGVGSDGEPVLANVKLETPKQAAKRLFKNEPSASAGSDVRFSKINQTDTPAFKKLSDLLGPASISGDMVSGSYQAVVDRLNGDSEFFSNLLESKSFATHGYGGLDVPTKRMVLEHMLSVGENAEIARRVIASIPVDVMNFLFGKEFSTKNILSNKSMLEDVLSVNTKPPIALGVNVSNAIGSLIKSVATNTTEVSDLANRALKELSASNASGGNGISLALNGAEKLSASGNSVGMSKKGSATPGTQNFNHDESPISNIKRITDSDSFSKWFGDSKVVDADGKPLVVYHGTNADFTSFDAGRLGEKTGGADALGGFFFAENPDAADQFTWANGEKSGSIMPVYLAIKKPARGVTRLDGSNGRAAAREIEAAKAAGHDGIVFDSDMLGNNGDTWVAFDPTQIKSAIGNNGNFDGANPDIRYSRAQIIGDSGRPYDQTQRQFFKNVGRDIEKKSLVERTTEYLKNDFWKKMAVGIVDQFRGLRDLGDNGQAYMLARLSKGTAGAFDALLHHGKLSIRDGVYDADTSGGFIDRLGTPLHGELDDFLWYVAANRAEGLSRVDRENLFTPADIAAGKSLARGQTNFDYTIQTGPQQGTTTRNRTLIYADANRVFNEFQKNTLDMAEQSGLIDSASRKLWESEFYVPFYRVSEEDGEFIGAKMGNALVRQQAFKKLKGGTDKLNSDLLSNTLLNFSHLIEASAKNRAAKASLAAAEQIGVAERVAPDMASYAASNGSMLPPGTKGTVWFQENGKKVEYKVTDPFVMTAITSLEYAGMRNGVMDVMTKFKHWLTIGVTASPAFKVRNLIRDSIQSIGASDLSYNPIKNIAEGYKQTKRNSQEYVSALASGGLIRFGTMLEGSESSRVRQLVKSGVKDSTILNSENKWRAFYDKYLDPAVSAYNELGNRSEEINRAALYNQLIKQGKSHAEAALLARDLMDFSMQGSFNTIRFLTQVVPFMNARLQGMYKLGRAAKDNPRKLAVVTGAVALASIALMLAYGDDDDWKRREDWDRDGFWWFKMGGIEFRIPKPFEVGAIGSLAERSLELMIDDEMTGERFRRVVSSLVMNNLSMNPIPQAFKPILDLYANKDSFTGRPIESMNMERLDPTERFNSNTSMVARGLSNATMGALSPVQYDHLARAYFGWLGSFVIGGADMASRSLSNEPTKPALDYFKFATQGMAKEAGTGGSRYLTQLYDQAKELEQAYSTYRHLMKDGRIEEAKQYGEENKDKLMRYKQVEGVKRIESKFNEQIHRVERSDADAETKKASIERIQRQKEIIAQRIAPGYQ